MTDVLDIATTTSDIAPSKLILRALDPADPSVSVVGWPGRRLSGNLAAGDMLIRQGPGQRPYLAIISDPTPISAREARARGIVTEGPWPGRFVSVVEAENPENGTGFARRVVDPDGFVLPNTTIIRPNAVEPESLPILPSLHPTVRNGSSGPAVAEAQSKLNAFHVQRVSQGEIGISQCPLDLDGRFGNNTRAAVISFQRIVFPNQAKDWDGVIGPKTWEQLEARAPGRIIEPPVPIPPLPIVPAVVHPLEPDRWAPILSAAASSSAPLRTGNAVRALIDGSETFGVMEDDIRAARGEADYIYLLGWDMHDDFELLPSNPATTMRRLLADASARQVQVRAMLWSQFGFQNQAEVSHIDALPNGAAILDDETANKTPMSTARLRAALIAAQISPILIPIIMSLVASDLARLTGSHHQKVLIVKRREILVAYCGGIDLNPNRIRVVDRNSGQPHHDDHCRIVGPSAWDLLDTFIRRWRHHAGSVAKDRAKGDLRGATEPVPTPNTQPSRNDAPFGGSASVIIARTFNPTRTISGIGRERDIQTLLRAAITNARSFIYLEDQYLVDLDTASLLRAALPRLNHVTILILGNDINDYPLGKEHRRDFVERMTAGLSARDLAKVGVFQLSTSLSVPRFGTHTYVHAKSWVIDDELAVIGSANCNRRGYQHDSEVDAFIFDDNTVTPLTALGEGIQESLTMAETVMLTPTFAQQYRMRLWSEHLGMPTLALLDGVASSVFWHSRPPTARVFPFDHHLPTSSVQTIRDIAADKLRFIIDPVP